MQESLQQCNLYFASRLFSGQFMRCPDKWSFNKLRATLVCYSLLFGLSRTYFFSPFAGSLVGSFVRDNLSCLARFLFGTLNMQHATCSMQHATCSIQVRE